jgi:hypothetical protein
MALSSAPLGGIQLFIPPGPSRASPSGSTAFKEYALCSAQGARLAVQLDSVLREVRGP